MTYLIPWKIETRRLILDRLKGTDRVDPNQLYPDPE